jgi:Mrr N-terminal domain
MYSFKIPMSSRKRNMDNEMLQQLENWKKNLAEELAGIEIQLEHLHASASEKREKLSAIEKLIGPTQEKVEDLVDEIVSESESEMFTPIQAYWKPILQTLVEIGGRSRRKRVVDTVGEKMKGILTKADYGKLPQSGYTRWRNRVAWQASNMRRDGYIRNDSTRGVWEITDAGRKWLDNHK